MSLLALSLGCLLCLPFVSVNEIGRGFFTLWAGTIALLGAAALALVGEGVAGEGARQAGSALAWLIALTIGLLAPFWIALRVGAMKTATALLLLSAVCGGLVLRLMAVHPASEPPMSAQTSLLRVSSLLLSALAVGMVTVAMVLGHWYLVQVKLAIAPLRRLCDLFVGILVARLMVSAWGLGLSLHEGFRFFGGSDPIPWEALIYSQRILFGFGGALILAVMIRKTVALRSTMSATGLLYIAILFVWVGEFLAIYLASSTHGGLIVRAAGHAARGLC
jgi:hypothetical protein